jgi:hypothetical protein
MTSDGFRVTGTPKKAAGLGSRAWARSPIVVTQVMALGLAWNFLGGGTTWLSVLLVLVAVVVLIGLLHPASIEALSEQRDRTR